jgi:nicotinamidase/pyrazinamidase
MNKNAFLGIDFQNDFCKPDGKLSVPGAEDDLNRIADFILRNKHAIHYIALTQDSHQVIDISHPAFWQDADGNFPPPYTAVTANDAVTGKWTPRYMPKESIQYLKDLESQGEFIHVIWPEHCLVGSEGFAIHNTLMDAVFEWARQGLFYQIVQKGQFPLTEHFGAFRANIEFPNQPGTQLNHQLVATLEKYRDIYFAGEAKTHCVANTLKQAMTFPQLAEKLIILEDCMSSVPGEPVPGTTFDDIAQPIYDEAIKMGIRFAKSTDINL